MKKLAGIAGLGVVAVVLAWLALGRGGNDGLPEHQRMRQGVDDLQARAAFDLQKGEKKELVEAAPGEEDEEPIPLDEDPRIRVVTPKCRELITKMRRNVPSDTLLDTIRDRSMRFDDDDIQCLSVGGAKPAILDMANWQRDRNKP